MKVRSILFSALMVQAIKDGRKTQTRRAVARKLLDQMDGRFVHGEEGAWCPYGQPGDRLVVREASWIWCKKTPNGTTKTGRQKFKYVPVGHHVRYCADEGKPATPPRPQDEAPDFLWKYKPGRFMPRWASRLSLEVTGVRVERLQDITEADAKAEGVLGDNWEDTDDLGLTVGGWGWLDYHDETGMEYSFDTAKESYETLWQSINGAASWILNPYVWAVSFKKVEGGRA